MSLPKTHIFVHIKGVINRCYDKPWSSFEKRICHPSFLIPLPFNVVDVLKADDRVKFY